jgi:hypothetical protein
MADAVEDKVAMCVAPDGVHDGQTEKGGIGLRAGGRRSERSRSNGQDHGSKGQWAAFHGIPLPDSK